MNSLIPLVDSDTYFILWRPEIQNGHITDDKYFFELDYLLDGLLKNRLSVIKPENKEELPDLYVSKNFGAPLYVSILPASDKMFETYLKQLSTVASHQAGQEKKIILLGNFTGDLKGKIKNYFKVKDLVILN